MPKSEREETMSALTSLILSSILDELVLDTALQAHHEVARSGAVCQICKTRCNAVHVPPSLNTASSSQLGAPSRSGTPSSNGEPRGTGSNTPTNGKSEGTVYLECINCSRQISSNRYAPHLSSCMGLSNSRRGAPRSNSKPKAPSDAGRSASPSSEQGYASDDRSPNKGKGRDESDYSLKRKRQSSPQISPTKKAKGKPSGSPISRVKANADGSGVASNQPIYSPANKSQSRVPSKLRDSSTASFMDRSSSSSRSSSPEGASAATPASSFTQSPNLSARVIAGGRAPRGRPLGTGPPKRPSPPRPPPPPIHTHYAMDVDEGDETGSSTDTSDSS